MMQPLEFGGRSYAVFASGFCFLGLGSLPLLNCLITVPNDIFSIGYALLFLVLGITGGIQCFQQCDSPLLIFHPSHLIYHPKTGEQQILYESISHIDIKKVWKSHHHYSSHGSHRKHRVHYYLIIVGLNGETIVSDYWIPRQSLGEVVDFLSEHVPHLAPHFAQEVTEKTAASMYVFGKDVSIHSLNRHPITQPFVSNPSSNYSSSPYRSSPVQPIWFRSSSQFTRGLGLVVAWCILGTSIPSTLMGLFYLWLTNDWRLLWFVGFGVIFSIIAVAMLVKCLPMPSLALCFTPTHVQFLNHGKLKRALAIQDIQTIHVERHNYREGYQIGRTQSSFLSHFRIEVMDYHDHSFELDMISSQQAFPLFRSLLQQHPHLRTKLHYHQNEEWESYLVQQFKTL